MNKNSKSASVPAAAHDPEATAEAPPDAPMIPESPATPLAPSASAALAESDTLNWQFWTPDPNSGLDIAWAQLAAKQFRVQLLYTPGTGLGSPAAGDSTSPLIVDTELNSMRTDVPFSLLEVDNPNAILSGSFNYQPKPGDGVLSVRRLRYPGGYVEMHVLFSDSGG
ncbi:hypothetical protein C7S18_17665 [Ahniella affigens]|uniref:Uncharacterized protein n=1 Tax=Ahniella affigens TaxID=2021234 RepID=A0A2P1PVL4_9GAMM|nr:hypothetical protein [Ahniella affigens]AVP98893.1 hypothetical protein C7S18_17665 [Ahniella affigens]